MSVHEQQNFLCNSAISQDTILHRIVELQIEINQLQLLYQQQTLNTSSKVMQQVVRQKIPVVDHLIPAVNQTFPVTGGDIPAEFPDVEHSIPVELHLTRVINNSSCKTITLFKSVNFFRSYRNLSRKNNCDVQNWPVANFLWWGKDVPPFEELIRDLWHMFDRPGEETIVWNRWKQNILVRNNWKWNIRDWNI